VDTSGFFAYPNLPAPAAAPAPGPDADTFLASASEDDWQRLLDACEAVRLAPGELLAAEGAPDRAVYLLIEGSVSVGAAPPVSAPATVGAAAFFDGRPRAAEVRAVTHVEALRLGFERFEALAAREPRLGRLLLLELGRQLAAVATDNA
jgi:CRP/FNR family transcriptional regulator, cyclic AMP receptor protein